KPTLVPENAGRSACEEVSTIGPARSSPLLAPVSLFDLLDFLFAQSEVVSDLMDERFSYGANEVLVVPGLALMRALKEQDPVRQGIAVLPAAFGEWGSLIQTEQRVRRLDLEIAKELGRRLVLDDDGDVGHGAAESGRDGAEGVSDELFESSAFHGRLQPHPAVRM